MTPPPRSDEAVAAGCTCDKQAEPTVGCPVHWSDPPPSEMDDYPF